MSGTREEMTLEQMRAAARLELLRAEDASSLASATYHVARAQVYALLALSAVRAAGEENT